MQIKIERLLAGLQHSPREIATRLPFLTFTGGCEDEPIMATLRGRKGPVLRAQIPPLPLVRHTQNVLEESHYVLAREAIPFVPNLVDI